MDKLGVYGVQNITRNTDGEMCINSRLSSPLLVPSSPIQTAGTTPDLEISGKQSLILPVYDEQPVVTIMKSARRIYHTPLITGN